MKKKQNHFIIDEKRQVLKIYKNEWPIWIFVSKIKMEGKTLKKSSHTMVRRFHEIFCKHFYVPYELYFFEIISWNLKMDENSNATA